MRLYFDLTTFMTHIGSCFNLAPFLKINAYNINNNNEPHYAFMKPPLHPGPYVCELQKTGVGSLRSANFKIVSRSANFCDRGGSGGGQKFFWPPKICHNLPPPQTWHSCMHTGGRLSLVVGDTASVIFHLGNLVIDLIAYGKKCSIPLVCLCKSCLLQR